jgi:hypothetical protein
MTDEQKREHFRVIYPLGKSAKLECKFGKYLLLDVSQRGIKFAVGQKDIDENWKQGQLVVVKLQLLCGAEVQASGSVIRTGDGHVALLLTESLPLKAMYDEHRYIIQHFGG